MDVTDIEAILSTAADLWSVSDEIEIALEANPNDANQERWLALKQIGLTRLSLGVQTFDDRGLKFLGRDHDGDQARKALDLALTIFPSVSLDLIFGWRGQSQTGLKHDLDTALTFSPHHISTYQLTIEDGTAFGKAHDRGQIKSVDEEKSADMFDQVASSLGQAGYEHYEVSNFARSEHRSRHNLTYWEGGDYIGLGPGAHGRLTVDGKRQATIAFNKPADYIRHVNETGSGVEARDILSRDDWAQEYILMGLRINEGISLSRYESISGHKMNPKKLSALSEDGFIDIVNGRVRATQKGRPLLNRITADLILD